ncbi:MAG: hypothetical protein OEV06_01170 [Anaerolineae bacterium]|nr:hypothetical protein [Anaerolineae bacterium]
MDTSKLRATGRVTNAGAGAWRLEVEAGPAGEYRLAQLDDYTRLRRKDFPHSAPVRMRVEARASSEMVPGTWGFGLWNDPFSALMGMGGGVRRLPAIPEAAWFFFSSDENHLTLEDDLPGHGATAATFRAGRPAWPRLVAGAPLLPLMLWRRGSQVVRRWGRRAVRQEAVSLDVGVSDWNEYEMVWEEDQVRFKVNGEEALVSPASPRGRLGLVIWLDNQYAAWRPDGSWGYGTLDNQEGAWIEIRGFKLEG